MKIISGPASKELAEKVSALTGFGNVPVAFKVFLTGNRMFVWKAMCKAKRWLLCKLPVLRCRMGGFSVSVHG